jgi:hypothetical protein
MGRLLRRLTGVGRPRALAARAQALGGRARALIAALLVAALPPATADAAGSSPVLMLSAADVFAAPGGERLLSASGAFNFDDLTQISFPAVGLMVAQATRFVRYEVSGEVIEATSALAGDGVSFDDLPALLALTGAAAGPARLVHLNRDELSVVLPGDFAPGPALVLLYAEHDGEIFLSPTIAVVLP